jgi:tripartite-type tricarboxylate transporter receptor subunit TctC
VLLGPLAGGVIRPARAGKVVSLIVGAPAGARADGHARAFAPFLERHSPHLHVNVVNAPGRAGLTALETLAGAVADGSVLGWAITPTLVARTVDSEGAADLLDRLRLVGAVMKEPIALVTRNGSALASVQDIIRRSSENADAVPLGTPPAGSPSYLAALRLQSVAATRLNIVDFPSAAAAREAALAGNVDAAMLALGDAIEALRDGNLVGLGVAARDRSDSFPTMPPLRESGLELSSHIRRGLAAPAALTDAVAAGLAAVLKEITTDPEFQAEADANGFIASWFDGGGWSSQARTERNGVAKLWRAQPWLPASTS